MQIEKTDFELGQIVHLVLNSSQKGQITSKTLFADGGCHYEVDYLTPDGEIRTGKFFACELEIEES